MVQVVLANGTVCPVDRFVTVLSPHDPEGKKTYHVGQIGAAKRRFSPEDVTSIAADWFGQ